MKTKRTWITPGRHNCYFLRELKCKQVSYMNESITRSFIYGLFRSTEGTRGERRKGEGGDCKYVFMLCLTQQGEESRKGILILNRPL